MIIPTSWKILLYTNSMKKKNLRSHEKLNEYQRSTIIGSELRNSTWRQFLNLEQAYRLRD